MMGCVGRRGLQAALVAALVLPWALTGPALAEPSPNKPETSQPRTARGDTTSFWLSGEASADSMDIFWNNLQREWMNQVPESISGFGLDKFQVDSLQAIGAIKLEELVAGTLWRSTLQLLVLPNYNRVQGAVSRVGWSLRNVGPNRPVFQSRAGYAFANQRPVFDARLEIPLIRRQWHLSKNRGLGKQYKLLSLTLSGGKDVTLFAGDDRRMTRAVTALIYGADPNHYYEERQARARLTARLTRQASWWTEAGYSQHRPLEQETDWNIFGRDLSPNGNRRAEGMDVRRFATGGDWRIGPLALEGKISWLRAENSEFVDYLGSPNGHADFRRITVSAEVDQLDPLGNQWVLRGHHRCIDRPAPTQWRNRLGGYNTEQGMLRGYNVAELSGEIAHQASLDLRLNFDLLQTLRIPVVKGMGWQPIVFVDWGKTRNQDGDVEIGSSVLPVGVDPVALALGEGEQGWRADVGFGFGRRFDLPGLGAFNKMRFYVAKPVGNGQGDGDWRILFGFER
ncbi:MAG: hypothetical protein KOO60_02245 [Gemmatimonadales bacterium]|nr:hypothetical protein [Gemmatimonadales bacterium]